MKIERMMIMTMVMAMIMTMMRTTVIFYDSLTPAEPHPPKTKQSKISNPVYMNK